MLKLTAKSLGGAVYVAVPHEANLLAFMSVPRFGSNYCFTLFRELSNKKWGNRDVVRKRREVYDFSSLLLSPRALRSRF